jgi:hypothetical protein
MIFEQTSAGGGGLSAVYLYIMSMVEMIVKLGT